MTVKSLDLRQDVILRWCEKNPGYTALLLFILNLGIKFYNISRGSFDLDEAWHTFFSQFPLGKLLKESSNDPNPPLYNLLIGFWIKIWGISEAGVRSFSVLLSALTAPLLYFFGRKHINVLAALYGALLFSASNILFFYSHDARVYSLVVFLTVCSFYTFFNLMKNNTLKNAILYSGSMTALLYTHTTIIFLYPVHFLAAFLYSGKQYYSYIRLYASQAASLFIFGIWVYFSPYYNKPKPTSWISYPGSNEIKYMLYDFFNFNWILAYVALSLVLVFLAVALFLKRTSYEWKIFLVLLMWSILPVAGNYVVSHHLVPIFETRYVLYTLAGVWMLLGYVISVFPLHTLLKSVIIAILFLFSILQIKFDAVKQEDWRGAVNYIKSRQDEKTLVIVSPYFQYSPFTYYYNRAFYSDYNNLFNYLSASNVSFSSSPDILIQKELHLFNKIILLTTHEKVVDQLPLRKEIEKYGEKTQERSFEGIHIYHYLLNKQEYSDNRSLYKNFENYPPADFIRINPTNQGHSKVYVIGPERLYCEGLSVNWGNIPKPTSRIIVSAKLYVAELSAKGYLVCNFERGGNLIGYNASPLSILEKNKWNTHTTTVVVPSNIRKDDLVKIYVWNNGKPVMLVDEIIIKFVQ